MNQDQFFSDTALPVELRFLSGGGDASRLILERDWTTHPLGTPGTWPDALKTSLSLVLNSPESMILAWGVEDLTFFFNTAYFPLLGPRVQWAMGSSFKTVWEDAWDQAKPIIDDAFAGRSRRFNDLPWKLNTDRGAAQCWFTFSYSRVLHATGTIAGLFIFVNETTERVLADEALRSSEAAALANFQRVQLALAAGAIIGTWVWDIPKNCFTADEPFANAFGLDAERCRTGIELAEVVETVHPDDQTGLADAINSAIARGGPYSHQYRVRRADHRYYWIEANGRVELAADGTPLSFPGVLINIEDRHAIERERDSAIAQLYALNETLEQRVTDRSTALMVAEEKLRQSQKMEAVGQLTGGLAHDFNNLLTGIMGNLELLQLQVARGRLEEIDRYVNAARGAGRRAASLTQRLLAFSRRQTLDPKPTDVNKLISGLEELLRRTVGGLIHIEVVGAVGLWTADIDAGQLESAILNLCINARDAMAGEGRITIETANKWLDERNAKERELEPGQYLSICVTDTGCGMTAETIRRAFEPFYTTKPIGQGTGLGLSMIYGFAQQSGGQVRIYSEPGQGTTVCIYLPRFFGDAEDFHEVEDAAPDINAVGQRILVVDDEPTIRNLIHEVLNAAGYVVLDAVDGQSALKIMQSGARFELLITDVGLPNGMNGRQVADAARTLQPKLKVLFITGYAENAAVGNGHLEPGMQLLTKPFSMEALESKVAEILESSVHIVR